MLINVFIFFAFFFVLYGIIGIQAFQGSLSRRCVVTSTGLEVYPPQACGGDLNVTSNKKGYLCPVGQSCMSDLQSPRYDFLNFDNIPAAFLHILEIVSMEDYADISYMLVDAESPFAWWYYWVVILSMGIISIGLFIAVIEETFGKVREMRGSSAFSEGTKPMSISSTKIKESPSKFPICSPPLMKLVNSKYWDMGIAICVAANLIVMTLNRVDVSPEKMLLLNQIEIGFTLFFTLEIIIRFLAHPFLFSFLKKFRNQIDLCLVIGSCIIQIPIIKQSPAYQILTIFQVSRAYRIVIAVPRIRRLVVRISFFLLIFSSIFFCVLKIDTILGICRY